MPIYSNQKALMAPMKSLNGLEFFAHF